MSIVIDAYPLRVITTKHSIDTSAINVSRQRFIQGMYTSGGLLGLGRELVPHTRTQMVLSNGFTISAGQQDRPI